jgi:hypothetical protein
MLKSWIRATPLYLLMQNYRNATRYRNKSDELIFIHIGKCGGSSLWDAIKRSPHLSNRFVSISKVHIAKPPILKNSSYIIVVRNPISRALSAFNWRYKLVVDDRVQKNRFEGEYEILRKYGTLNSLAEQLYDGDVLDSKVAKDFRSIHHLKEDISFYLTELLNEISANQIYAVLATESLDKDIEDHLGVDTVKRTNENAASDDKYKMHLSKLAKTNMRKFLNEDYAAVERLLAHTCVTDERRRVLLE